MLLKKCPIYTNLIVQLQFKMGKMQDKLKAMYIVMLYHWAKK